METRFTLGHLRKRQSLSSRRQELLRRRCIDTLLLVLVLMPCRSAVVAEIGNSVPWYSAVVSGRRRRICQPQEIICQEWRRWQQIQTFIGWRGGASNAPPPPPARSDSSPDPRLNPNNRPKQWEQLQQQYGEAHPPFHEQDFTRTVPSQNSSLPSPHIFQSQHYDPSNMSPQTQESWHDVDPWAARQSSPAPMGFGGYNYENNYQPYNYLEEHHHYQQQQRYLAPAPRLPSHLSLPPPSSSRQEEMVPLLMWLCQQLLAERSMTLRSNLSTESFSKPSPTLASKSTNNSVEVEHLVQTVQSLSRQVEILSQQLTEQKQQNRQHGPQTTSFSTSTSSSATHESGDITMEDDDESTMVVTVEEDEDENCDVIDANSRRPTYMAQDQESLAAIDATGTSSDTSHIPNKVPTSYQGDIDQSDTNGSDSAENVEEQDELVSIYGDDSEELDDNDEEGLDDFELQILEDASRTFTQVEEEILDDEDDEDVLTEQDLQILQTAWAAPVNMDPPKTGIRSRIQHTGKDRRRYRAESSESSRMSTRDEMNRAQKPRQNTGTNDMGRRRYGAESSDSSKMSAVDEVNRAEKPRQDTGTNDMEENLPSQRSSMWSGLKGRYRKFMMLDKDQEEKDVAEVRANTTSILRNRTSSEELANLQDPPPPPPPPPPIPSVSSLEDDNERVVDDGDDDTMCLGESASIRVAAAGRFTPPPPPPQQQVQHGRVVEGVQPVIPLTPPPPFPRARRGPTHWEDSRSTPPPPRHPPNQKSQISSSSSVKRAPPLPPPRNAMMVNGQAVAPPRPRQRQSQTDQHLQGSQHVAEPFGNFDNDLFARRINPAAEYLDAPP